jgi:hypothetical protein
MRHYRRRTGEPERDDVATLDDLGAAAGWGSAVTPEAAAIESEERAAIARWRRSILTIGVFSCCATWSK